MIGFYNYSVILTYIGLVSSVFGITQVFENHMSIAFLCLLLSGICDLFDGKISRSISLQFSLSASSYRKHYDSYGRCYQTWLLQRYGGRASEKHNREQKRI